MFVEDRVINLYVFNELRRITLDSRAVQTLLCSHFLPSEELGKFKAQFKTVAAVLAFCLLSRWEILSPTFAFCWRQLIPLPYP